MPTGNGKRALSVVQLYLRCLAHSSCRTRIMASLDKSRLSGNPKEHDDDLEHLVDLYDYKNLRGLTQDATLREEDVLPYIEHNFSGFCMDVTLSEEKAVGLRRKQQSVTFCILYSNHSSFEAHSSREQKHRDTEKANAAFEDLGFRVHLIKHTQQNSVVLYLSGLNKASLDDLDSHILKQKMETKLVNVMRRWAEETESDIEGVEQIVAQISLADAELARGFPAHDIRRTGVLVAFCRHGRMWYWSADIDTWQRQDLIMGEEGIYTRKLLSDEGLTLLEQLKCIRIDAHPKEPCRSCSIEKSQARKTHKGKDGSRTAGAPEMKWNVATEHMEEDKQAEEHSLELTTAEKQSYRDYIDKLKLDHQAEIAEIVKAHQADIEKLKARQRERHQVLAANLDEERREIGDIQWQAELDIQRNAREQLKTELESKEREIKELRTNEKDMKLKEETLSAELTKLQTEVTELAEKQNEYQKKVSRYRTEAQEKKDERALLLARLEEKEEIERSLLAKQKANKLERDQLQLAIERACHVTEALRFTIQGKQNVIQALLAEVRTIQSNQCGRSVRENAQQQRNIVQKNDELETTRQELQKLKTDQLEEQQRVDTLRDQMTALQRESDKLRTTLEKEKEISDSLRKDLDEQTSLVNEMVAELEGKERSVFTLHDALDNKYKQVRELTNSLNEERENIEKLRLEIKLKYENTYELRETQVKKHAETITMMKTERENLYKEVKRLRLSMKKKCGCKVCSTGPREAHGHVPMLKRCHHHRLKDMKTQTRKKLLIRLIMVHRLHPTCSYRNVEWWPPRQTAGLKQ